MITKKTLLRTLYIVANYGGDGAKVSHGECLILFHLFYEREARFASLLKLLPSRNERTVRRNIENLVERKYVNIHKVIKDGRRGTIAEITDLGEEYCIAAILRSEAFLKTYAPLDSEKE